MGRVRSGGKEKVRLYGQIEIKEKGKARLWRMGGVRSGRKERVRL